MRLTLLGTASAEGLPGLFCRCRTCATARDRGGRDVRTRSSALIDDVFKIDFPPDIHAQIVRSGVDLSRLSAVLFTHGHDDHFCPSELQYRGRYFVETLDADPLPIYGTRDVIERLNCTLNPDLMAFSLHLVDAERPVRVAGYEVTPFRAQHDSSRTCLNFVIRDTEGATVLYASDTGWYSEETWRMLDSVRLDGVVVECTQRDEGGYEGHLSIPEVLRMRERLLSAGSLTRDAPVIATHFCHLMGLTHEELEARLAVGGVHAGYDGMVVQIRPGL